MPHVDLPQAEFKVVLLGDTFTGKTSLVLRFAEGYYRESARSATVGAFFITKRITVPSVGLTCKIQIWDTAGQEQFKPLAPMYYKNAAAAIVCYDPSNAKSLETLHYWLDELHKNVPAGRIVIAMAACKCDLLEQQPPLPPSLSSSLLPPSPQQQSSLSSSPQQQQLQPPNSPSHSGTLCMSTNTIPTNNTTSAASLSAQQTNNHYHHHENAVKQAMASLQQVEELAAHVGAIFVPTSAKNNENVNELFTQVAERVLQFQKKQKYSSPNTVTLGGGAGGPQASSSAASQLPQSTTTSTVGASGTNNTSGGRSSSLSPRMMDHRHYNNNALLSASSNNGTKTMTPMSSNNNSNGTTEKNASRLTSSSQPGSRSTSPLSSHNTNNMSREEYLHRRSHHIETTTPGSGIGMPDHHHPHYHHHDPVTDARANNHHTIGAAGDSSPTRFLPKTSPYGMDGSPILANSGPRLLTDGGTNPQQQTPTTTSSVGGMQGLAASATMCGDTDFMNCAVMPYSNSGSGDHSNRCVIL